MSTHSTATSAPALVGISHGTSSPSGQAVVQQLFDDAAAAITATSSDTAPTARLGHVDVQQPDVAATVTSLEQSTPGVVVPLLLSAGFHVNVDLTQELAKLPHTSTITRALGPDDRITSLLAQRLEEAEVDIANSTIILGAAGSSDSAAVRDCEEAAARLAARLNTEVTVAYLSFAKPSVKTAVEQAKAATPEKPVAVASYLLAPGFFQHKLISAEADVTTEPLLAPDRETAPQQLVEVVRERYEQGVTSLRSAQEVAA